jgi:hypothetical protein
MHWHDTDSIVRKMRNGSFKNMENTQPKNGSRQVDALRGEQRG